MNKRNGSTVSDLAAFDAIVLDLVRSEILGSPTIEVETQLLDSGLLDSLGIVGVAEKLECHFGLELPPDFFKPQTFETARAISDAVRLLTPDSLKRSVLK